MRGQPSRLKISMGFLSSQEASHVESIVFFLSEALRSAVEAADRLQHSPCELPQLSPNMDCSEITLRLAGFRNHVGELWSCELLMLTKLMRARQLAKELRTHTPELKPEIDTFRLATSMVTDLRDALTPTKDSLFDGKVQPKRFLEDRGYENIESVTSTEPLPGYKIAGQLDVRLLIDACEALHFRLAARFGFETPTLTLEDEIDSQVLPLDARSREEAFLLSDLGEILSDSAMPMRPLPNTQGGRNQLIH